MEKISQDVANYIQSKYTYTYRKWHIGITSDIKQTKKLHQSTNKIVCEYTKSWPCENIKQARKIKKEIASLGLTICKDNLKKESDKKPLIYVFLAITKDGHKLWKILNKTKRQKGFFLID